MIKPKKQSTNLLWNKHVPSIIFDPFAHPNGLYLENDSRLANSNPTHFSLSFETNKQNKTIISNVFVHRMNHFKATSPSGPQGHVLYILLSKLFLFIQWYILVYSSSVVKKTIRAGLVKPGKTFSSVSLWWSHCQGRCGFGWWGSPALVWEAGQCLHL